MSDDLGGVLSELAAGRWRHPVSGERVTIPIEHIVIQEDLAGSEGELVRRCGLGARDKTVAVVGDQNTREVLGRRVFEGLKRDGLGVEEIVWADPHCSEGGVDELRELLRPFDEAVAVGSGTINDSVKYATFLDRKPFATFPTSPMTAHFTGTASVSFGGLKKSLTTHNPKGVFVDLAVLKSCPKRLVWSAYGDVICRTTAQVDWLLSHRLFGTAYSDTPYHLLAYDEADLLDAGDDVAAGDDQAFAMLTRMNAIMGLGTGFTGTSHCGSMGEHMLSHYIDMFAGDAHPGTHHGEQVGVATMVMSRLQHDFLLRDVPPRLHPSEVDETAVRRRFGDEIAGPSLEQFAKKALDGEGARRLSEDLERRWPELTAELRPLLVATERLERGLIKVSAPTTGEELGLSREFWQDAVRYARFTRDRFSMLDIAGDAGELDTFADTCR
ncbi:MAG: iron-containing alcohol dehydrogenase [Geminicoccaceae bacterium]